MRIVRRIQGGNRKLPKIGDIAKSKEIGYNHENYDKYIWSACIDCGKERWVSLRRGKPANIRCRGCAKKGENNCNWKKNGRIKSGNGYIFIRVKSTNPYFVMGNYNNYILEHRLIMAKHLGRCLESWEVVHHINGVRNDNRIKNLILVNKKEHRELTSRFYKEINKLEKEKRRLKKELYLCKQKKLKEKED